MPQLLFQVLLRWNHNYFSIKVNYFIKDGLSDRNLDESYFNNGNDVKETNEDWNLVRTEIRFEKHVNNDADIMNS